MADGVTGKRVALLVEDEFEDRQVTEGARVLREAGVEVVLVGPIRGRTYRGRHGEASAEAELAAGAAKIKDFDGVVVPGGYAPDKIRMRHAMVDLVRDATATGKPVAAIAHGAQVLISANALRGRTITCWPSIAVDVKNAGGLYVDRPVVEDGNLITSRKSDDLPFLCEALLKALGNVTADAR